MGSKVKTHLFKIIDILRKKHSLQSLFDCAEVSKAGYYKWKQANTREDRNTIILEHIKAIHSVRPFFGYRRMQVALQREGLHINHKRVYRLMRSLGISSTIRKKRRYFGKKGSSVFPNLLQRKFHTVQLGTKLVTDITYLPTTEGFLYLSVIQDLCNNEIIAHRLSKRNDLDLVLTTISDLEHMTKAILHSDQGFQYTNNKYQERLS